MIIDLNLLFKSQTNNAMADQEEIENREQVTEKVKKFMLDGCGCTLGEKGGLCSQQFSEGAVLFNLKNLLQELSSDELDLVILANMYKLLLIVSRLGKKKQKPSNLFLLSVATYL